MFQYYAFVSLETPAISKRFQTHPDPDREPWRCPSSAITSSRTRVARCSSGKRARCPSASGMRRSFRGSAAVSKGRPVYRASLVDLKKRARIKRKRFFF